MSTIFVLLLQAGVGTAPSTPPKAVVSAPMVKPPTLKIAPRSKAGQPIARPISDGPGPPVPPPPPPPPPHPK